MNIIFGEAVKHLPDSFLVLELDTFFYTKDNCTRTAYCVLDNLRLEEYPVIVAYRTVHERLLREYRDQNWEYCRCAIKELKGRWSGSLDSFYDDLYSRIEYLEANPPTQDWQGYRIIDSQVLDGSKTADQAMPETVC